MQNITKLSFTHKLAFLFMLVFLLQFFLINKVSAKGCADISDTSARDSCYEISVRHDGAGEEACALIKGTVAKDSCYDFLTMTHVANAETCGSIDGDVLVKDNCFIRVAQYITPLNLSYCDGVSSSVRDSCYIILGWRGLGAKSCFATSNLAKQNECMIYLVHFSYIYGVDGFLYSMGLSVLVFSLWFILLYFLIKKFYLQKRGGILVGLTVGILNLGAVFVLPPYNFLVFNVMAISEFICPPGSCRSDFLPDPRIFAVFFIVPGVYMLLSLAVRKKKKVRETRSGDN